MQVLGTALDEMDDLCVGLVGDGYPVDRDYSVAPLKTCLVGSAERFYVLDEDGVHRSEQRSDGGMSTVDALKKQYFRFFSVTPIPEVAGNEALNKSHAHV